MWLTKYNKLFRILFNKYHNSMRNNVETDFGNREHQGKYMNLGETLKFLKDHDITPDLLTKEEAQTLLRLLTMKTKDINNLDFESFQQFFI